MLTDPAPQNAPPWPLLKPPRPLTAQWPSKAWLAEKFPVGMWNADGSNVFAIKWFGYSDSWETLLSAWEDEVFTVIWPGSPLPYSGLLKCLM